tara:strand:- start:766 stop:1023 length:258 start_codon:yes stop_codon:yes gene_type:complete
MKNKYFKFNIFNINIVFYLLLIIIFIILFDYKLLEGNTCGGEVSPTDLQKDGKDVEKTHENAGEESRNKANENKNKIDGLIAAAL